MRGKNKIWMIAAVFIASLAITMISVPKAYAYLTVKVIDPVDGDANFGPYSPNQSFDAKIMVDEVYGLHAFEFTLSWNPNILRLNSNVPVTEGPFLPSRGTTYLYKSVGVDQGSLTVADLLEVNSYAVDTQFDPNPPYDPIPGVLAIVHFDVIGGGSTDLTLTAELYNTSWVEMGATAEPGHFFSPFPYIDFKYFIPVPIATGDFVEVTGMGHYNALDGSGNPASYNTEPYTKMRPVLYPDYNGSIADVELVPGTMFFGDKIIFNASGSYDYNNAGVKVALPASAFHYTIKAGGVDTINVGKDADGNPIPRDVRYDSGVELPTGPEFTYIFPGKLPYAYSTYGSFHLGWFEMILTIEDSDHHVSTLDTWIRIFKVAPESVKMVSIPNKKVHAGETMLIGGKMQNGIGRGIGQVGADGWWWYWEDSASGLIALGRAINTYIWVGIRFTITDAAGHWVDTLYSPAVYMTGTELPSTPIYTTWTVPDGLAPGFYTVTAKGVHCGTGNGYGLTGLGIADSWFQVLP